MHAIVLLYIQIDYVIQILGKNIQMSENFKEIYCINFYMENYVGTFYRDFKQTSLFKIININRTMLFCS